MQVLSSLKTAKQRHRDCQVVRRKGKVYVICKSNPRFKARQLKLFRLPAPWGQPEKHFAAAWQGRPNTLCCLRFPPLSERIKHVPSYFSRHARPC